MTRKLATFSSPKPSRTLVAHGKNPEPACDRAQGVSEFCVDPPHGGTTPAQTPTLRRKRTAFIELRCASEVRAALIHSLHLDKAPNRHMVIDWELAGVTDSIAATGRLLKLMRDALRRHGHELCYVWVREVSLRVGEHVHILFHLPTDLSGWLARRKPGWLKRCGARRLRGASKTRVVRGSGGIMRSDQQARKLHVRNLDALHRYVLKHCSGEVQYVLGIRSIGPCPLEGKRVSISQNLNRATRRRCQPHALVQNAEYKR